MPNHPEELNRRIFLKRTAVLTAAALAPVIFNSRDEASAQNQNQNTKKKDQPEVYPTEDLMREHGALSRVLLIYENIADRLKTKTPFPNGALGEAAGVIRRFIEDYHEKLEEDYLFPRFEKAGILTDLVQILRAQHDAGRRLTDLIKAQIKPDGSVGNPGETVEYIKMFSQMYRPHKAREDTVLFPALRSIMSSAEFSEIGEKFEDKEKASFGKEGFEKIVSQIGSLEKSLGIFDLKQFTPKLPEGIQTDLIPVG